MKMLEEQVVGLVDEDDGHVGDGLRRACLAEAHEERGVVVLLSQLSHGVPLR